MRLTISARLRPWLCVFLLGAAPPAATATSFVLVADGDLADSATVIAEVRVAAVDPAPGAELAVTDYLVDVEHLIAGDAPGGSIVVRVPGGRLGDGRELHLSGAPRFAPGERALLFLEPRGDGTHRILFFLQGAFRIGKLGSQRIAYRDLSGGFELAAPAPRPPEAPRDLERFGAWLAARARGVDRAADYRLEPAVGHPYPGEEKYTLLRHEDGFPGRWRVFDSGGSVQFKAHASGQPGVPDGGFLQFVTALGAWTVDPDTPVSTLYGGTITAGGGLSDDDGVSSILFDDPNDYPGFSAPFECGRGGTLAIGGWWTPGPELHGRGGTEFLTISEGDIVTNKGAGCVLAESRQAEELFGHELGHTLGLGHSCGDAASGSCNTESKSEALMRAAPHLDGRGAVLQTDDRLGLALLYGAATPGLAAPGDLAAEALSPSQIRLTWQDRASGETGVEIERQVLGAFTSVATAPAGAESAVIDGLAAETPYAFRVRALGPAGASPYSDLARATTLPATSGCAPGPTVLCLQGGRFQVEVRWQSVAGGSGDGRAVPSSAGDSGLLWFFDADNWEMLVKVLDGCGINGHYWVFAAATTDVGYTLRVRDTARDAVREYVNPLGTPAETITDATAFASCP